MLRLTFIVCTTLLFFLTSDTTAQTTRKVLFLGNSYTGVNNLPQLIKDVALSVGDTLIFDSYTPGGYTLKDHSGDPTSQGKIMAGDWDYVVLQGQSQEPITQNIKFNQGANALETLINQHNPCAVTLLYMTWGRKNGDPTNCAAFPVMCTYEGMDSTLRHEYLDLADDLNGEVSPVSVVWHHLRQNNPSIELYQADESHPSKAGSYAAACSFYAAVFKKDPTEITFNYNLPPTDADIIRKAAQTEVFDQLNSWDYKQLPQSSFQYQIGSGANEVIFNAINQGATQTYQWDFGDGDTSTVINPTHSYAANGTYTITLTTTNCDLQGTHTSTTDTVIQFCSHTPTITTSHPWLCNFDTLWTQPADDYQWYSGGAPIPETRQFLPNYQRYSHSGFSVQTTVNGCAERSQVYDAMPEWSGYFFDSAFGGDPCEGDTALFVVLHFNGTLPDSTIIHWYKNGALLPNANNEDTLRITSQGSYMCKVINPSSQCPQDTTSSSTAVYDCGSMGTKSNHEAGYTIYPNPTTSYVRLEFPEDHISGINVYNIYGQQVLTKTGDFNSGTTSLNVSHLPNGFYTVELAGRQGRVTQQLVIDH